MRSAASCHQSVHPGAETLARNHRLDFWRGTPRPTGAAGTISVPSESDRGHQAQQSSGSTPELTRTQRLFVPHPPPHGLTVSVLAELFWITLSDMGGGVMPMYSGKFVGEAI